jgi:tight adherence protein B
MRDLLQELLADPRSLTVAAVAVGLGMAIAVWVLVTPSNRLSRERRQYGVEAPETTLTRATNRVTGLIETVLKRGGDSKGAVSSLERAGIRMALPDFILMVGAGALTGLAAGYVIGGPIIGIMLAALVVAGAFLLVSFRRGRRESDFADQLDDIVSLLGTNLRAGHSLLQSLDGLAQEVDEPAQSEMTRVVNQVRVGRDLGPVMEESADRMHSDDFRWVAQAVAIHRQVGGNLADVLDTVGDTIRERNQIRRQVKALSAEGKLSAYVLMALPILVTLALSVLNPEYVGRLTESALGYAMIASACVLLTVGGLLLRKVVTIKF